MTTNEHRRIRREAVEYGALCHEAERLGIATSLDDPDSPKTVAALADAVVAARQTSWRGRRGEGPFPLRSEILSAYPALTR